jgi:alpha-tubulin suppressor-like RCC1 family protein
VWAWGDNYAGQLATGTKTNSWVPVRIPGLTGITSVAAAIDGTIPGTTPLALKSDGTVWAWGANAGGQLGNGTSAGSAVPVQVSGLTGVTSIAASNHSAYALKADGSLWAWGDNSHGQLGDGTTEGSTVPVQVTGVSNVLSIALTTTGSTPGSTIYARKKDGTVWAWGYNYEGQLGNGTRTNSSVPVQVSGLTGITNISAGYHRGYALRSDGTVWSWGDGFAGGLGNGTTSLSAIPVRVSGLIGVTNISAGFHTGYAMKGTASVWSWGANGYGILGNGSAADSSVPVQVGP